MVEITIFEEAMCCSTGVCGPDPDEELVSFTHAVDTLEAEFDDAEITRVNMSSDMDRFLEHEDVADAVQSEGPEVLPITVVDGEIVDRGEYPSYESVAELIESSHTQEA
ncbi:arsenite efflux transporter metallochaperone ArsD [Natronorubrum bangense]|uniref:Arsenic resistance protein ArsD n=2 Tax=Natronorubrum bangense TaxID=61858 RepID=L9WAT6_9EURY|nr:arsenite efflux transporter metallochaperone ArsD [Natronorubrum bangense]ELY46559.1 arsenic resistance protein ArsD [Natronorubrum bangense JCM 10635]QCC56560.1 arsenical resistance operon transcriptional repressor ArsD [Natronorubrum bangense]